MIGKKPRNPLATLTGVVCRYAKPSCKKLVCGAQLAHHLDKWTPSVVDTQVGDHIDVDFIPVWAHLFKAPKTACLLEFLPEGT